MSLAGSRSSSSNHRSTPSAVSSARRPVAAAWALSSSAIAAASRGVGWRTDRSAACTELLLPDVRLPEDVHSRALVKAGRSGGVVDVDAERDRRLADRPEPPERVAEQRKAEAAASPGRPDAQRPDEAPVPVALRVVPRECDDLVAR